MTTNETLYLRNGTEAPNVHIGRDGKPVAHIRETKRCTRCGGAGYYPSQWHGACFKCGGLRPVWDEIVAYPLYTAKRLAGLEKAAATREAKRVAKAEAARVARETEAAIAREITEAREPGLGYALETIAGSEFGAEMAERLERVGELTERQVVAVFRMADDIWNAGEVPTGRVDVKGKVLTVKVQHGHYGVTVKMLVKAEGGFKVWGTVPRAIDTDQLGKGAVVAFTATVEPSDDDPAFGFYKRPSKAELLEPAPEAAE